MTHILLVRHAQSTWNADGRWQGRADPPLSPLGAQQAVAAVDAVREHAPTTVFSSPLVRARETARIVADGLGLGDAALRLDERLMERDAGEWTGLTRDEIESGWPGFLVEGRRPPAFEPDAEMVARALDVLHAIAEAVPGGRVLAVSHGGLIRVVERHLGGDGPPLPNLAGRHVDAVEAGFVLGERVLCFDPAAVDVTTPRQI